MKNGLYRVLGAFVTIVFLTPLPLLAQGTAFTYQGRLNDGAGPAGGSYDFRFRLAADPLANNYVGGNIFTNGVPISNGLFTVTLDFGGVFNGSNYWMEIAVRTNGGGGYSTLNPLQPMTPTPYAIFAAGASNVLGVLPSGGLSGSYGGPVTFNNPSDIFNGSHGGNGSALTGVNAASLGGVAASNFWKTIGNAGTSSTNGNFLGTADNQPLELKVNNQRALRLEPAPDSPNIIGGNSNNSVAPGLQATVIAGGGLTAFPNTMLADFGTIGGGTFHTVAGSWGTVGGGRDSSVFAESGTVAGGYGNTVGSNGYTGFIGGGHVNSLDSQFSTVAGGELNVIGTNTDWSFIGGGYDNVISNAPTTASQANFIGGGSYNNVWGNVCGIGAGSGNIINTNVYLSFIGGGQGNFLSTGYSFLGGGVGNTLQPFAQFSVMGGGQNNTIASGADHSFLGGGAGNTNGGSFSSIPGGYQNFAGGQYSLAAGRQARATNNGAFVWADSTAADFSSSGPDQFLVRANGGLFFANGAAGVNLDYQNLNGGDINYGLHFGFASGEGIASKRTAGGNQYGLDFYTQFTSRMSLTQDGTVIMPGLIRSGVETNNSDLPSPAGLVVRRINSFQQTIGQILARTDNLTLERDGTSSGLLIRYPGSPGRLTINLLGVNNAGNPVAKHYALNPVGAGTQQLFLQTEHLTHAEISFGITYLSGRHFTQVVMDRFDDGGTDDNYWSGTMISSFNQ